jgi:hypothetical protein
VKVEKVAKNGEKVQNCYPLSPGWSPKSSYPQDKMMELFRLLYERDYVGIKDVRMVELWISELNRSGYVFPKSCRGPQEA